MIVDVFCWNLGGGNGKPRSVRRSAGITETIAAAAPSFACLQEAAAPEDIRASELLVLAEALGMQYRWTVADRSGALPVAVLWDPDRAELREWDIHYTSLFYHGAGIATFDVAGLDRPLSVASVHMHPHSGDKRAIEAACFHMKADRGQNTIIGGDFNGLAAADPEPDWTLTRPGNVASRCLPHAPGGTPVGDRRMAWNLAAAGYTDACDQVSPEPTGSHIRVDWILVSQALAPALVGYGLGDNTTAARMPEPGQKPDGTRIATSDHRPVWCRLDLDKLAEDPR